MPIGDTKFSVLSIIPYKEFTEIYVNGLLIGKAIKRDNWVFRDEFAGPFKFVMNPELEGITFDHLCKASRALEAMNANLNIGGGIPESEYDIERVLFK